MWSSPARVQRRRRGRVVGVIACDPGDRITMVNDEARRLLVLGVTTSGGRLTDLLPTGRLREVLTGGDIARDEVVLTDDRALLVNKMLVVLTGQPHGSVITLRDRTEIAGLIRELDGVRRLTETLRAQHHEFTNTMHTVAGLIELGEHDEALSFLTDVQQSQAASPTACASGSLRLRSSGSCSARPPRRASAAWSSTSARAPACTPASRPRRWSRSSAT